MRAIVPGAIDPLQDLPPDPLPAGWACLPQVRHEHVAALNRLLQQDLSPPDTLAGEGVVLVGGGDYWPGIVVSIRMLRKFSALPVQVWHDGVSEPVSLEDLAGIPGVAVRNLREAPLEPRLKGWSNKTTAIINCGWRRVLYLDADAYAVADPGVLLDVASRRRFAFWSDLDRHWQNIAWHWWGIDPQSPGKPPPVQGGQLAIDLRLFWRELVLAHWACQHWEYFQHWSFEDREKRHGYGEQDAWRAILLATRGTYECLGKARVVLPAMICDLNDAPLIVHRVQGKLLWRHTDTRTTHLPGDKEVFALVEDLLGPRATSPEVFAEVYASGIWGPPGTSGQGSDEAQARPYLDFVNGLIEANDWQAVVDLGCGDGRITSGLRATQVIGVDCVSSVVFSNRSAFPRGCWELHDMQAQRQDLPAGDVALVKDVFHHWPAALLVDWLLWARTAGKWKYVVFTQDCRQTPGVVDATLGGYRALDPCQRPLRDVPCVCIHQFLHKAVLLLPCVSS
jgi:Mannosyltransferase putative